MSIKNLEVPEEKTRKDKSKGRPRVSFRKINLIGVRLSPSLSAAIEEYILDQHDGIGRPEAIRRIVCEWLAANSYLTSQRLQATGAAQRPDVQQPSLSGHSATT